MRTSFVLPAASFHPRSSRGLVSVLVGGALLLGGCSLPGDTPEARVSDPAVLKVPDPALEKFYTQEITWTSCREVDPPEGVTSEDHECATLEVPRDHAAPDAATLELALTRLPAAGDRTGALVVNPGGPGGSGVDYALQATFVTSEAVRDAYDIVGFDPRGVARSSPVDCLSDQAYDQFAASDPSPESPQEVQELRELASTIGENCQDDPTAPHVDTVSVARDMDILRAVLGEAELDFLGKSYGSVLGAMYAELHPQNVGRFVLDGAVDLTPRPAQDTTLAVEQAQGFEAALESFVADCLTQSDCPLEGEVQDGTDQIEALLLSLEERPLPTGDPERPLTQGLGLVSIIGPLYQYDLWPALRNGLTGGLQGDGEVLLLTSDLFSERNEDDTYRTNAGEAIYAVNCLDGGSDPQGRSELTTDDFDALAEELATEAPVLGPQLAYGGLACLDWPFEPVAWPEIDGEGAPDILVIGTSRDPATPLVWAERLSEQLTSGRLLTYDGDGHTAYGQTGAACIDRVVDTFLLQGTLPEEDLTCTAEYPVRR